MPLLNSQFVKATALDVGFDACGLAEAAGVDPEYLADYDGWLARGGNAGMDFLVRHRDLRSHPANLLPGTRTVICLLLSYKSDALIHTSTPSHLHTFPLVAQYSYPPDYHDRLRHLLHTLAARLREAYPGMECRPCVDSAPLPEKYWAIRAGLGWRGRNTLLVNPTFGTFCNLGELLVTLPADRYDTPLPNGCPDGCHACVKACPNGALQHTPSPLRGTPPNLGGEPKKPAPAHSSPMRVVSSGDYEGDEAKSPRSRQLLSSESSSCFPQRAGGVCSTLTADRYDTPLPNGCPPGCHACVKACPNGALQHTPSPLRGTPPNLGGEPKKPAPAHSSPKLGEVAQRAGGVCSTLTADLCTAYHTIENRDPELPAGLDTAGYAFGCDLCQLACPYNRTAPARYHLTPERRAELESLATADEEQFHRVTRGTPMSRIKYSQWLRNLAKLAP